MEGFLKIFLNRKCHSPIFVKFYNPYLLQINPLLNNFELDLIYKMQLPTSNSNNIRSEQIKLGYSRSSVLRFPKSLMFAFLNIWFLFRCVNTIISEIVNNLMVNIFDYWGISHCAHSWWVFRNKQYRNTADHFLG